MYIYIYIYKFYVFFHIQHPQFLYFTFLKIYKEVWNKVALCAKSVRCSFKSTKKHSFACYTMSNCFADTQDVQVLLSQFVDFKFMLKPTPYQSKQHLRCCSHFSIMCANEYKFQAIHKQCFRQAMLKIPLRLKHRVCKLVHCSSCGQAMLTVITA